MKKTLIGSALLLALSGCGGGSSSNEPTPAPNNTGQGARDASVLVDNASASKTVSTGQAVELILYAPDSSIANIQWSQLSGTNVELLSASHKLVSVVPTQSGNYQFQVNFNENGVSKSLTTEFDVSADQSLITVPSGQSVRAQNKVSLRAFGGERSNNSNSLSELSWQQTSGPTAAIANRSEPVLIFDAPVVNSDTVLTFEVTARANGQSATETVSVLVEQAASIAEAAYFDDRVANVFPYNRNSQYANQLVNCVYSNTLSSSCTLQRLPLIAQQTLTPTVDDIMDRVVVSHQWMGDNFKAFLTQLDPHDDFKQLLRATTAVVISYDVRPSFYWAATGAIYLDPENFWLTPRERDTINEAPDFRSNLGGDLQFAIPWRYVKDNEYAFESYDRAERVNRPLSALTYPLGYLLYHELAHANDFFPQTNWPSLERADRVLDAALENATRSDLLTAFSPLNSQVMRDLAQVRYRTGEANDTQKAYLPQDIQTLFAPDKAVHFYSYSSEREDFAMLFEELMMQHRYGVIRDVAITNNPDHVNSPSDDYIVQWGQRGRLAQPQITDRIAFTSDYIYPEFNAQSAIERLPNTLPFIVGETWRENLSLSPDDKGRLSQGTQRSKVQRTDGKQPPAQYHYYTKPLPQSEQR
ncbi:hypothetical protein DXX93_09190 [Thalassotalea euphylliae]|uniref:Lipoprotein n=1 Tax=Thalassotalea euphylliae TaxID=1655234 RepID=A0A3E0TQB7_9GAMM|nr:hypothetical protein [Thalassotalea euphylliae]REL26729.1 hypothetical protein DXX93_09190 [Thalassotalea euphylliae]